MRGRDSHKTWGVNPSRAFVRILPVCGKAPPVHGAATRFMFLDCWLTTVLPLGGGRSSTVKQKLQGLLQTRPSRQLTPVALVRCLDNWRTLLSYGLHTSCQMFLQLEESYSIEFCVAYLLLAFLTIGGHVSCRAQRLP